MDGGRWGLLRERPAAVLAGAALLVVAAWFALFPADASVTSDDGAYAVEVISLEEQGSWSVPHVLADVDEDGATYPFVNTSVTDDGYFPGGRHAAWVQALRPGYALAGAAGMRVLPAIGIAIAVAAAASLARRMHGVPAGWTAGALVLASPVLFQGLQLWGHAFAAGGVAVAATAAVRASGGRVSIPLLLSGAVASASASAVRADSFVFASAVAAVTVLSGVRGRDAYRFGTGVLLGMSALIGYVAAGTYAASILGSAEQAGVGQARGGAAGMGSFVGDRVAAAVQTFISLSNGEPAPAVLTTVALAIVVAAILAVRRGDTSEAAVLLYGAVGAWLVRVALYPDSMASGLLGAWPVVLIIAVRKWDELGADEKRLLAMVGLGAIGIAATQYPEGGGLNWGGRFVLSGVPLLAVVVAGSLVPLAHRVKATRLPQAIVALVIVTMGASLVFDAVNRTRHAGHVDGVAELTSAPVVTVSPALPRLAWRLHPDVQWLRVPLDEDGTPRPDQLLRLLRRAEVESISLYAVTSDEASVLTDGGITETVAFDPVTVDVP